MQVASKATLASLCLAGLAGVYAWRTRRPEHRLTVGQRAYARELARQLLEAREDPDEDTSPKIRHLVKLLAECAREGYPAMEVAERVAAMLGSEEPSDDCLLGVEQFLSWLEEKADRNPGAPTIQPEA